VRSRTVTTVLEAPKREVFAYLADVRNLPDWATEFARELKIVGGKYKVANGLGELFVEIHADEETGVIDMLAGPTEEELAVFPTRVIAMGDRRSAFIFTMFQQPGQPQDLFDGQYESLLRELAIVEDRFGG
jgi:hypothetical protein